MRRFLPWRKRFTPPRTRLKLPNALPDVLWTSILALNDSADAFPPLKSALGAVVAVCQAAERTQHCKSEARAIALRVMDIVDVVADAVPDGSDISSQMLDSIFRFSLLLDEIRSAMEDISLAGALSRFKHLNRNESRLQNFKVKLDNAYRDFLAASTLRLEVQQTLLVTQQKQLAIQQTGSTLQLENISAATARLLIYSQFMTFFWPSPDAFIQVA
ncbi:hypothetical protein C8R45DRAFT_1100013 [Mycena sanguinolenta]|nr:hypothetical protein C8R45DRAFT_1100013 [Mycena sanguinolenta]